MKRLLLLPVTLALLFTGAACRSDAEDSTPEAATPTSTTKDCGYLDQLATSSLKAPSSQPPELVCMQEALADHRAAEVTIKTMGTDSGPYDNTYRLDRTRHVALDVRVSKGGTTMGDQPYTVACTKPDWLPGAICPPPPPPMSRPAPFTLAPGQRVTPETTAVDVLVHPTRCTAGRTAKVLEPAVSRTYGQVRVLFRVDNRPDQVQSCAGVAPIRARIDLRAPLGDRWIVDDSCIQPSVYWRDVCKDTRIRARAGR